jgi:type II secretory pathway component PulJ
MKSSLQHRSGFTLLEMTVACWLTALLAVLLSTTWVLLMRPTADLIASGQLFQEMDIAVTTLARDLGGSLPDNQYAGAKKVGRLLGVQQSPADSNKLELWFDGGNNTDSPPTTWSPLPDDTVIDYYVNSASNSLIRSSSKASSTPFTVANNVASMIVTPIDATHLQIDLTFSCVVGATNTNLTRKCTLIVSTNP